MSKKRGSLDGLIATTVRTTGDDIDERTVAAIDTAVRVSQRNPGVDKGQGMLRDSLESSGRFVPGSVTVTEVDGAFVVEGVLKGRIHEITIDGSIEI